MGSGDAREDGAGKSVLAEDVLAGGDRGEGAGGGNAESVHGFADQVFAQDRADGGLAVAAAGKGRATRAFQLYVAAVAVGIDDLTEQEGAAVAELRREAAELMAGVGLGDRGCAGWQDIAGEYRGRGFAGKIVRVEAEFGGELRG